jgi:hypothetical protein
LITLLDLELIYELQSFLLNVFTVGGFGKLFIALEEDLNGFYANGDELLPSDFTVGVFVSEGEQHTDVALTKVVLVEHLESIKELNILQLAVTVIIVLLKQFYQGTFKCADESGRVNVNFL